MHKPLCEVEASLEQAEAVLAKVLGVEAGDVPMLPAEFAAGLDADWIGQVGDCTLECLAAEVERIDRVSPCWLN